MFSFVSTFNTMYHRSEFLLIHFFKFEIFLQCISTSYSPLFYFHFTARCYSNFFSINDRHRYKIVTKYASIKSLGNYIINAVSIIKMYSFPTLPILHLISFSSYIVLLIYFASSFSFVMNRIPRFPLSLL